MTSRRRKSAKKAAEAPETLSPQGEKTEEFPPRVETPPQRPGFDLLAHEGVAFVRTF